MRLEGKTIAKIHYKGNSWVWRQQRIQDQKVRKKVPEREINVKQNWSLGHSSPYTNDHHKDTGWSNISITDETIMVSQYAKMNHIKSKGVMATNEQGGSMLNNRS